MTTDLDSNTDPSPPASFRVAPLDLSARDAFFDNDSSVDVFEEKTSGEIARAKSALRLKYEAEMEVIRRKLGDLEAIRSQLGLSQRKMAQLLLVDPSAWTRWTKGGESAPPHVYRMLQWYLALENKYPVLDVNFWLNTVAQVTDQTRVPELEVQLQNIRAHLDRIEARSQNQFGEALETIRLEMNRRELQTRKLVFGLAMSAIATTLVLSWFIYLLSR